MTRNAKEIFAVIVTINVIAAFFVFFTFTGTSDSSSSYLSSYTVKDESLAFIDPFVANQILTQLDVFEELEVPAEEEQTYRQTFRGLKLNFDYCKDHRAYLVNDPSFIFNEKNFVTDFWLGSSLRLKTIPEIGKDLLPKMSIANPPSVNFQYNIDTPLNAQIFFTNPIMFRKRIVGKQFSCLTQISNHALGHDYLYRKDSVGGALVNYTRLYKEKSHCFNSDTLFPKTWLLTIKDQCEDFFSQFLSEEYEKLREERTIVYYRKIGAYVHEGKGVFPVHPEEEVYIREKYQDGELCGIYDENNIVQLAIYNPLLIHGSKFHFRVFMFLASANPFIAFYHDGYLRISLNRYDPNSRDLGTFVTNIGLFEHVFKEAEKNGTYNGMTKDELQENSTWFYNDFQKYALEKGLTTDPNWINNHVRAELKKAMTHLLRMTSHGFVRKSSVYELYGCDFVMDENLNIWFIEANTIPLLQGWTPRIRDFFHEMLVDSFEIVFGLLRSRTKRMIKYVNELTKQSDEWDIDPKTKELMIPNLEGRREEFRRITSNKFEPEYRPSPNNGFYPIIDENLKGKARYFDIIPKDCLLEEHFA